MPQTSGFIPLQPPWGRGATIETAHLSRQWSLVCRSWTLASAVETANKLMSPSDQTKKGNLPLPLSLSLSPPLSLSLSPLISNISLDFRLMPFQSIWCHLVPSLFHPIDHAQPVRLWDWGNRPKQGLKTATLDSTGQSIVNLFGFARQVNSMLLKIFHWRTASIHPIKHLARTGLCIVPAGEKIHFIFTVVFNLRAPFHQLALPKHFSTLQKFHMAEPGLFRKIWEKWKAKKPANFQVKASIPGHWRHATCIKLTGAQCSYKLLIHNWPKSMTLDSQANNIA